MRRIFWSEGARRDYLDILRFIAADDADAAHRVAEEIDRTVNDLGTFATGRPGRVAGTYEKSVARLPYIIAYALQKAAAEDRVVILRVIHGARHWPEESWPQ